MSRNGFDRGKREARLVAFIAVALVLLRCFVPVWYEGFDFDSDQAVVGLMAKHLTEQRAFPLFFYGQHYMLGVQAWIAAPFFLMGGPTVLMLRLPLVIINVVVALLLLRLLVTDDRMRPATALVASLPLLMPPPLVSTDLLQTLGASVEPLLYVLLLWILRRSPIPFGLLLAVGFLHREFTIFALPALTVVMALDRSLFTRQTLERAITVVIACLVVWIVVDFMKGQVDVYGPPTGPHENSPLTLQMQSLVSRICVEPRGLLGRIRSLFEDCLVDLFGARTFSLGLHGINSTRTTGSGLTGLLLLTAAPLMLARLGWLSWRSRAGTQSSFCLYLALVGLQAAAAYPLACEVVPGYPGLTRYVLLALFIPVALTASYLNREPVKALKTAAIAVIVAWTAVNLRDNVNVIREYRTNPPTNKFRVMADYLVDHGIRYSRAGYWDAYILDFLTRERAIVASDGKVRIREYEQQVEANRATAAQLVRTPCSVGKLMEAWCIVDPPRR